jgi:hypothetical protein
MNLPDDYEPSQPIDDRRGATYYGRNWATEAYVPRDRGKPTSLIDLMYAGPEIRSGLSRDLGYNMVGQDPQMEWRNRLPLPGVPLQNYPASVPTSYYEPPKVGWDQPWTTAGRPFRR